jgi:hypothetical protein
MTHQPEPRRASTAKLRFLISVVIGGALGGLAIALVRAPLRQYWHLFMVGGAAAATLAVALLDLNDRLTSARRAQDRGQLAPTLQSCLLAFLIFAVVIIACGLIVFGGNR